MADYTSFIKNKYFMSLYKRVNWTTPAIDQLKSIIPIFDSSKAYVRPLPVDVQHKIFKSLVLTTCASLA
jgi:hypothetical protein